MKSLFAAILGLFLSFSSFSRPNILVLMVDDLDMQVWNKAVEMGHLPNISNRLIADGTQFTNLFATQSLCCPSRATYNTGQYSQNHEVFGNDGYYAPWYKNHVEDESLPVWLKESGHPDGGYRTGHFGKYLNNSGNDPLYVPPGWDTWEAFVQGTSYYCMYGYTMARTGATPWVASTDPADYQTDVLKARALLFLQVVDSRPFYLFIAPTVPHDEGCVGGAASIRPAPRHATPNYDLPTQPAYNEDAPGVMTDKPAWMQALDPLEPEKATDHKNFYNQKIASLMAIDDMVGALMDELVTQGKTDTVFIFMSDNGYQYGTHRLKGKQDFYEESIRIPMVIKTPGQTANYTQTSWVLNNDWAVTIADFADVTPLREVDGTTLRPLLYGEGQTDFRKTFLIRSGANPEDLNGGGGTDEEGEGEHIPFLAVRTRESSLTGDPTESKVLVYAETYNFADGSAAGTELYDLDVDPYQMSSLHLSTDATRLAQKDKLQRRLNKLKTCHGSTCKRFENVAPQYQGGCRFIGETGEPPVTYLFEIGDLVEVKKTNPQIVGTVAECDNNGDNEPRYKLQGREEWFAESVIRLH